MTEATKINGRLEYWYYSPTTLRIAGHIYDDPDTRWPEGTQIHTSRVVPGEFVEGQIVNTLNSAYLLGKPFPIQRHE